MIALMDTTPYLSTHTSTDELDSIHNLSVGIHVVSCVVSVSQ
jgi:hypothetical protein